MRVSEFGEGRGRVKTGLHRIAIYFFLSGQTRRPWLMRRCELSSGEGGGSAKRVGSLNKSVQTGGSRALNAFAAPIYERVKSLVSWFGMGITLAPMH